MSVRAPAYRPGHPRVHTVSWVDRGAVGTVPGFASGHLACCCDGLHRCLILNWLSLRSADFKNVSIVGHYIKERTAGAQFVIISLRNNMFELAERLVGIYKTDNATKTVAINPGRFAIVKAVEQTQEQQAISVGVQG